MRCCTVKAQTLGAPVLLRAKRHSHTSNLCHIPCGMHQRLHASVLFIKAAVYCISHIAVSTSDHAI